MSKIWSRTTRVHCRAAEEHLHPTNFIWGAGSEKRSVSDFRGEENVTVETAADQTENCFSLDLTNIYFYKCQCGRTKSWICVTKTNSFHLRYNMRSVPLSFHSCKHDCAQLCTTKSNKHQSLVCFEQRWITRHMRSAAGLFWCETWISFKRKHMTSPHLNCDVMNVYVQETSKVSIIKTFFVFCWWHKRDFKDSNLRSALHYKWLICFLKSDEDDFL